MERKLQSIIILEELQLKVKVKKARCRIHQKYTSSFTLHPHVVRCSSG